MKHLSRYCEAVCAVGLLAVCAPLAKAENWPSWRGPENDGISHEKGLPITWSETKNLAWKLPLPGKGSSTPAIWGDRIFMTAAENSDLILLCASTQGKLLWKRKISTAVRSAIRKDEANEASASPSTDGKHVFAFVGTGDVACFDFEGNEIWKLNVQGYGRFSIQHGVHNTPVLHENRLYLSLLHANGHWVIALDKATGAEVWKIKRPSDAVGESREAYSSPFLWKTGKETSLVVLGCDYTTAHSLKDGAEIWRLEGLNPKSNYSSALRIIATPVGTPDILVVPTARGGLVVGVKPGATGSIKAGSPSVLWRIGKGSPDVPSPLVHDGHVYLLRELGQLLCVDAKDGHELHQDRFSGDRYRASPVYADGKIYLTSRDGYCYVLTADAQFKQLAKNQLPDNFTASPAISQGRIYLRGFGALYAIQEGAK